LENFVWIFLKILRQRFHQIHIFKIKNPNETSFIIFFFVCFFNNLFPAQVIYDINLLDEPLRLISPQYLHLSHPKNKFSTKGVTQRLRAFCATHADYIEAFNPPECKGYDPSRKSIIRKHIGITKEFIYIKTFGTDINDEIC